MSQVLIFILGAIIGGGAVWVLKKNCLVRSDSKLENKSDYKPESKVNFIFQQTENKAENKQAVLKLLENQEKLTNNDIQKMLGISDATATRYLDELEKEGKIKQIGATGHAVYYIKTTEN